MHTLVTLGTHHHGTYTAYGWNSQLTKQLRPGSGLMRELDQPVPDCQTRFVAYWSDLDQLIFPQRFAALEHPDLSVRNIDCTAWATCPCRSSAASCTGSRRPWPSSTPRATR